MFISTRTAVLVFVLPVLQLPNFKKLIRFHLVNVLMGLFGVWLANCYLPIWPKKNTSVLEVALSAKAIQYWPFYAHTVSIRPCMGGEGRGGEGPLPAGEGRRWLVP